MSINELEMKCRELRQLQALIDEAQAEAETIKDAIKAAMGTQEAVTAGEYKITWKPVTTSRLDTAALKKALPDGISPIGTQCEPMGLIAVYGRNQGLWDTTGPDFIFCVPFLNVIFCRLQKFKYYYSCFFR